MSSEDEKIENSLDIKLEQKYDLSNIDALSYAQAVNIKCASPGREWAVAAKFCIAVYVVRDINPWKWQQESRSAFLPTETTLREIRW